MKVFVCREIPEVGIKNLERAGFEVEVSREDRILSPEELKKKVVGVDAVLSLLSDKMKGEVMDSAGKNLKIVANYAVGYDNIDLQAAKERNIYVTNTPGVLTEAVAEHTFALLLAVAKRIAEADKYVRAGKFKKWEPLGFLGPQIWGKTLGIVGLGRIGSFVAQIARGGFNMEILYYDVKRNEEFEMRFNATYHELDTLLRRSDAVTLHVPLMPQTRHLIGYQELRVMKNSAILINTARGPVVDEKALVEALKKGWIGGAGLDVYEHEPKLTAGLDQLENAVLTPHTASATHEARDLMSRIAAENIIAALQGKTPPNLVR